MKSEDGLWTNQLQESFEENYQKSMGEFGGNALKFKKREMKVRVEFMGGGGPSDLGVQSSPHQV